MKRSKKPDVRIKGYGSLFLFCPLTKAASKWVKENVSLESWQWIGGEFSVEHRMVENLIQGMQDAGLRIA